MVIYFPKLIMRYDELIFPKNIAYIILVINFRYNSKEHYKTVLHYYGSMNNLKLMLRF